MKGVADQSSTDQPIGVPPIVPFYSEYFHSKKSQGNQKEWLRNGEGTFETIGCTLTEHKDVRPPGLFRTGRVRRRNEELECGRRKTGDKADRG